MKMRTYSYFEMILQDFAKNRRQFGRTIDTYGNVQEKLVRMAMRQYVTESLAFLLAQNMDRGIPEYQCKNKLLYVLQFV